MPEITGLGAKLQLGDATGTTFTDVANLVSVKPPAISPSDVEIDEIDGEYTRSIPGPIEAADIEATINLTDTTTNLQELVTLASSREIRKWKVVFPNGFTFQTEGYLKVDPQELTRTDIAQVQLTIRCTTLPTTPSI